MFRKKYKNQNPYNFKFILFKFYFKCFVHNKDRRAVIMLHINNYNDFTYVEILNYFI